MKGPKPKLFSFQDSLPRLPVPDLEETMVKYLRTVRPLATAEEFAHTEAVVKQFLEGDGRRLQAKLQAHSDAEWEQGRNWLQQWWLQFAYLMWPQPLPLHSNVFFYFVTAPQGCEHIFQAARLVTAFVSAKGAIDRQELPVEFTGPLPMDMGQHKMAFTTARIPGEQGDSLVRHEPDMRMVVLCAGRIFTVPLVDAQGALLCCQEIERRLRDVWARAHDPSFQRGTVPGVPALTSEERPTWARWRQALEKDAHNAGLLATIDKAAMLLTLDDADPESEEDALRLVAGGDCANRWFDKGFNVVVFRNGMSGMNAEHSPAEATMHDSVFGPTVFKRLRELGPWAYPDAVREPAGDVEPIQELTFNEPAGLRDAIDKAYARYATDFADLEVRILKFTEFGADWAKQQRLPIDSVVQMAIQLAWGRMHGPPVATYETSHLRCFRGGRTETCRSVSLESAAWVNSVIEGASLQEQRSLFKQAVEAQKNYMVECIKAKGIDRHLLGLRILAMQSGEEMPALFTDPLFARSSTWRLSTSTVRTTEIGGFPPVCADGYGLCYMFWRTGSTIVACVTARRGHPETNALIFQEGVKKALHDIRAMWEASAEASL